MAQVHRLGVTKDNWKARSKDAAVVLYFLRDTSWRDLIRMAWRLKHMSDQEILVRVRANAARNMAAAQEDA